jgi:transcriptional regulator with XRE-family HTH domain
MKQIGAEEDLVGVFDEERVRQGLTKKQLADKCQMSDASMRRLLSSRGVDVKLSTLKKIASALGATIVVSKIDVEMNEEQSRHLIERLRRMRLSERLAEQSDLDASDIEHALYNLTLTPSDRLARRFRNGNTRLVSQRR